VSTVNCRIVNYVETGDRSATSLVSLPPISDHKRRAPLAGRSYKDSPPTTIDYNVAAGLVPA